MHKVAGCDVDFVGPFLCGDVRNAQLLLSGDLLT